MSLLPSPERRSLAREIARRATPAAKVWGARRGDLARRAIAAGAHGPDLASVVALPGAAVAAVPIFRRLGLGSVIGTMRRRDAERFALEASQGMAAGRGLLLSHRDDWLAAHPVERES
jgi:hypothetical protein